MYIGFIDMKNTYNIYKSERESKYGNFGQARVVLCCCQKLELELKCSWIVNRDGNENGHGPLAWLGLALLLDVLDTWCIPELYWKVIWWWEWKWISCRVWTFNLCMIIDKRKGEGERDRTDLTDGLTPPCWWFDLTAWIFGWCYSLSSTLHLL